MHKSMRRTRVAELQENRFYQLPKFLVHDPAFKSLSGDAKILYSIIRDRHELSLKNNWVNEDGEVYIIYTRENMMEDLDLSNKTITKYMKELKKYGLIEEERQGLNKPNLIYVCVLDLESQWKCKKYTSGSVKSTLQEVKKVHTNDTEIIDTEVIDTTTRNTKQELSKDSKESVVVVENSPNKFLIESRSNLTLTPYQVDTVSKWDAEKLNRALEIYNANDGQKFALLLKIYRAGAINNLDNTNIATQYGTGSVSNKIAKHNAMPSHDWDFDEIEVLEREYIDRKIASQQNKYEQ